MKVQAELFKFPESPNRFGEIFDKIAIDKMMKQMVNDHVRYDGVFIHLDLEPQREFPRSRHWGFEEFEP